MDPVTAVLVGAGDRGMDSYAPYALANPDRLRFVAVADPDGRGGNGSPRFTVWSRAAGFGTGARPWA